MLRILNIVTVYGMKAWALKKKDMNSQTLLKFGRTVQKNNQNQLEVEGYQPRCLKKNGKVKIISKTIKLRKIEYLDQGSKL